MERLARTERVPPLARVLEAAASTTKADQNAQLRDLVEENMRIAFTQHILLARQHGTLQVRPLLLPTLPPAKLILRPHRI